MRAWEGFLFRAGWRLRAESSSYQKVVSTAALAVHTEAKICRDESHGVLSETSHQGGGGKTYIPLYPRPKSDTVAPTKTVKDMPGPAGLAGLPYIGQLFLFYPFTNFKPERSDKMFSDLHHKYGPIVKYRKGLSWNVLLFDPDLIEEVMTQEGKYPVRPSLPLFDVYAARTGRRKGMSQLQGEDWHNLRRPVQEFMLQPPNINQYTPVIDQVANDMALTLKQQQGHGGQVQLSSIMLRYAIESSGAYCIDTRLGFLHNSSQPPPAYQCPHGSGSSEAPAEQPCLHFRQLTDQEREELIKQIKVYMKCIGVGYYSYPFYKFFRTPLYRSFERASKYMSQVVESRVTELAAVFKNKGQRSQESTDVPHLLSFLLNDGRLDLKACSSMLSGFFSTATDNISNSLVIMLWNLAKNVHTQNKLRDEINECIPSRTCVPQEALSHMPYLKACLKESHRLMFPTPFGSARIFPGDITLDEYHIPAGTTIYFGHNILGHSDKYFPQPEKYLPERWLNNSDSDPALRKQRKIVAMPFGFGKRNCVGRRLAELQIYLAVIKILQNFELRLTDPHVDMDIVYTITATPSTPLNIEFNPI